MNAAAGSEIFAEFLTSPDPLIDVRAPVEFENGHFANSINLPILDDAERHQVGLCYREQGQDQAIVLGHQLVSGATKTTRVAAWLEAVKAQSAAAIYCWRGGLRSELAQQWLAEAGCTITRIPGGYKAMRQYCLSRLEQATLTNRWLVLAGRTGSGKTQFLKTRNESIDLEGFAEHRGSAFGGTCSRQPSLPTFEHQLARAFQLHKTNTLLLEDESRTIGRLAIPESWFQLMKRVPVLVLEVAQETRINNIYAEYVAEPLSSGTCPNLLKSQYLDATNRIRRRLGGDRHQQVIKLIELAFEDDQEQPHREWIGKLLECYYDPMYDYQLQKKLYRVVCRGDERIIANYLNTLSNS